MICDDHDLFRTAFTRLLEVDGRFSVIAQAGDREQLLFVLSNQARDIDVLLLDLKLGSSESMGDVELIHELLDIYPALRILVVSGYDEPEVINAAMTAGAFGFVTKGSPFEVLKNAVRHIHLGEKYLDPRIVNTVYNVDTVPAKVPWNDSLSKREQEILILICKGHRVSEIAVSLNLSIKTISTHKIRLMKKLKISNNVDLIKLGVNHRLC